MLLLPPVIRRPHGSTGHPPGGGGNRVTLRAWSGVIWRLGGLDKRNLFGRLEDVERANWPETEM